jgi:hypothetical protein
MTSILKVDNIKDSANNQAISISGGVVTFSNPPIGDNTGKILQVVHGLHDTAVTTTSNSAFVTSGVTATITPSSTSSKIYIMTKTTARNTNQTDALTAIFRGTVSGINLTGNASTKYNTSSGEPSDMVNTFLDSPNTTSATTYTLGFKTSVNGQAVDVNVANTDGVITLMEVAG